MKYEAALNIVVRFDVDEDELVNIYGEHWRDVSYIPNEMAVRLSQKICAMLRTNPEVLAENGWSNNISHARAVSAQAAEAHKSRHRPVTTTFMPLTTTSMVDRWNSRTRSFHEHSMTEELQRFVFLARRSPAWDGTRAYVFPELDETNIQEIQELFTEVSESIHESYQQLLDKSLTHAILEYLEGCEEDGIQGARKSEPVASNYDTIEL